MCHREKVLISHRSLPGIHGGKDIFLCGNMAQNNQKESNKSSKTKYEKGVSLIRNGICLDSSQILFINILRALLSYVSNFKRKTIKKSNHSQRIAGCILWREQLP